MPRTKSDKPKRNIWKDPSAYGSYQGEFGSPEQWASDFKAQCAARWDAAYAKTILQEESPWDVLGIPAGSAWNVIKAAFRKLALRNHPDQGGDPAQFRKIMAAYVWLEEQQETGKPKRTGGSDEQAVQQIASSPQP